MICPTCKREITITPVSQLDVRWKNVPIGKTKYKLKDFGCTISSLCMALHKLRGYTARPDDAAKFWKFDSEGRIVWTQTKFKGMKFVWRGYGADMAKVTEYANDPSKAVILNVDAFGKQGAHWVYLNEVKDGKLNVIDPLGGGEHEDMPDKYKFCGYALFEKM